MGFILFFTMLAIVGVMIYAARIVIKKNQAKKQEEMQLLQAMIETNDAEIFEEHDEWKEKQEYLEAKKQHEIASKPLISALLKRAIAAVEKAVHWQIEGPRLADAVNSGQVRRAVWEKFMIISKQIETELNEIKEEANWNRPGYGEVIIQQAADLSVNLRKAQQQRKEAEEKKMKEEKKASVTAAQSVTDEKKRTETEAAKAEKAYQQLMREEEQKKAKQQQQQTKDNKKSRKED